MARLKAVIGCTGREMMNVVKSDITGELLQNARQFEIGCAFHGSILKISVALAKPSRGIETMLHREQPYTGDGIGEQFSVFCPPGARRYQRTCAL